MANTSTSSNTSSQGSRFANRMADNGPSRPSRAEIKKYNDGFKTKTRKEDRRKSSQELIQVDIPRVDAEDIEDPLKKDFNKLVEKNPHIDTVQKWIGKAGDGLSTAKDATGNIFASVGGITKLGFKKSTSNATATTVLAGGGSAIAGLLSIKSLINTFKHFTDPKTGSWLLSGIQAIIQGGVAVGLGAPFFGKGEKSPFIKRVDGEDVVEVKALLGGVGASVLLWAFDALSKDRLPVISKIPGVKKLAGGIAKDIRAGIDTVTTSAPVSPAGQGLGAAAGNQNPLGLAA